MVLTSKLKSEIKNDALLKLKAIFSYGAVGSSDSVPSPTQQGLVSEVLRKSVINSDISGDSFTATLFIGASDANGFTLAEAGFFDQDSNGNMHLRDVFDSFLKTDDISLYIDANIEATVVEL